MKLLFIVKYHEVQKIGGGFQTLWQSLLLLESQSCHRPVAPHEQNSPEHNEDNEHNEHNEDEDHDDLDSDDNGNVDADDDNADHNQTVLPERYPGLWQ